MLGKKNKKGKDTAQQAVPKNIVRVNAGAGTASQDIIFVIGDTVADILEKAKVQVPSGKVVTLGSKVVNNVKETKVDGGDILVISSAPSNG